MTATLKDRLLAKRPARVVVPVVVGDLSDDDQARLVEAQTAAVEAASKGDEGSVRAALTEAAGIIATVHVEIEFEALPRRDFEQVVAAYPSADADDGGIDSSVGLPILAALCAVDSSLQDDDYWRTVLASWSSGEQLALWAALLRLNTAHVPSRPKG